MNGYELYIEDLKIFFAIGRKTNRNNQCIWISIENRNIRMKTHNLKRD